jgi:hypothetical protein
VLNPENGHLYLPVDTGLRWHAAVSYCNDRGGYLVTVQSDAENEFVFRLNPGTWLGASDEAREGVWVWANGEPWSYTHWYEGEPNNVGETGEHYLSYWDGSTTGWNDLPLDAEPPFICEWDGTSSSPGQSLTLTSVPYHEENATPPYTLDAQTPQLAGSDDPPVLDFNTQAAALVQAEIDAFRTSMDSAPNPPITGGSFYEITYELKSPWGDLLSLKFNILGYFDGAAHPYHYSITFTYDLSAGRRLELADLFLPGADYLGALSGECVTELSGRDIGFDVLGADPTPENYQRWNVTVDGLLITFDAYQVAPYAAGPQEVLISYATLAGIIDPDGLLAAFIP